MVCFWGSLKFYSLYPPYYLFHTFCYFGYRNRLQWPNACRGAYHSNPTSTPSKSIFRSSSIMKCINSVALHLLLLLILRTLFHRSHFHTGGHCGIRDRPNSQLRRFSARCSNASSHALFAAARNMTGYLSVGFIISASILLYPWLKSSVYFIARLP